MKRKFKWKPEKLPKIEFWRKEYADSFKDLQTLYIAELTQIKKLLKVFSAEVVIKHFKNNDLYTIRFLTKDESKELIFNLFKEQIEYIKSLNNLKKTEIERVDDKVLFIEQAVSKKNNILSKGL